MPVEKPKVSLEDWFAGLAMQALLSRPDRETRTADEIAHQSYVVAGAMLKKRGIVGRQKP